MPRVTQSHRDARRRQILDAARARFAEQGFARTSMPDLAEAAGLSIGAIYRYFPGKEQIVAAVCDDGVQALPDELTSPSVLAFLDGRRAAARDDDHARLVAQIYAEAAVSPGLAAVVDRQLAAVRAAVAERLPHRAPAEAAAVAEAFTTLCAGYTLQLAVRGDVDPAPYAAALMAIVGEP
jgi:TetR/AcrR family transcriptional regulator, transcriptional repressor of aconitase